MIEVGSEQHPNAQPACLDRSRDLGTLVRHGSFFKETCRIGLRVDVGVNTVGCPGIRGAIVSTGTVDCDDDTVRHRSVPAAARGKLVGRAWSHHEVVNVVILELFGVEPVTPYLGGHITACVRHDVVDLPNAISLVMYRSEE